MQHFALASIGEGVREAYVTPDREAALTRIAADGGADARVARDYTNQRVGARALQDVESVLTGGSIDASKAQALEKAGLLQRTTEPDGTTRMRVTEDAIPLLQPTLQKAVAVHSDKLAFTPTGGNPADALQQHVRIGMTRMGETADALVRKANAPQPGEGAGETRAQGNPTESSPTKSVQAPLPGEAALGRAGATDEPGAPSSTGGGGGVTGSEARGGGPRDAVDQPGAERASSTHPIDRAETNKALLDAVNSLAPRPRDILMARLRGKSLEDIAREDLGGASKEAAAQVVNGIMRRVKAILAEKGITRLEPDGGSAASTTTGDEATAETPPAVSGSGPVAAPDKVSPPAETVPTEAETPLPEVPSTDVDAEQSPGPEQERTAVQDAASTETELSKPEETGDTTAPESHGNDTNTEPGNESAEEGVRGGDHPPAGDAGGSGTAHGSKFSGVPGSSGATGGSVVRLRQFIDEGGGHAGHLKRLGGSLRKVSIHAAPGGMAMTTKRELLYSPEALENKTKNVPEENKLAARQAILAEELAHLSDFNIQGTDKKRRMANEKTWKNLLKTNPTLADLVPKAYTSADSDAQLGEEYLRMLVQTRAGFPLSECFFKNTRPLERELKKPQAPEVEAMVSKIIDHLLHGQWHPTLGPVPHVPGLAGAQAAGSEASGSSPQETVDQRSAEGASSTKPIDHAKTNKALLDAVNSLAARPRDILMARLRGKSLEAIGREDLGGASPQAAAQVVKGIVRRVKEILAEKGITPPEPEGVPAVSKTGSEESKPLTPTSILLELLNADRIFSGIQRSLGEAIAKDQGGGVGAGAQRPRIGEAGYEAERKRQQRAVVDWAKENGRAVTRLPSQFEFDSPDNVGGAEHDVWFDEPSRRWLKVTKPSFGVYPSVKGGKWILGRATPAQYLEKLAGLKELFHVETPVHGVLLDVRGNPSFIVSQADIAGEPVDQAGITKQLKESGFVMVADNSATYYRPSDNTMLFDAHPDNVVLKDGKLFGFDVGVIHPEGELKEMMERDHAAAMKRLPAPAGGGNFLDQARRAAAERGESRTASSTAVPDEVPPRTVDKTPFTQ